MKRLSPLVLTLALAFAAPAIAQTPLDPLDDHSAKRLDRMEAVLKELRAIVFQGRETGKPIVVEPADTDSQLAGVTEKLNDLQLALTRINGQLEVTTHALDQAQHETDALREENGALKDRLTRLEQKIDQMNAPPPPPAAPQAAAPAEDPAAAFAAARAAYMGHDDATAEAGFRDFVDKYGDTPRGPEARYFLGKTLLARHAYADAAAADVAAVRLWPQTIWAPDAVLDLSRALIGMGKPSDACQTLDELTRRYPKVSLEVKAGATAARGEAQCS
ncbi:MAG: tetratricopeptide repeat protein [Caulobacterales bacterium]